MYKAIGLLFGILLVPSTGVFAGDNPDFKAAIHVLPHEERYCNINFPEISACAEIVYTYEGCGDIDFFPVFFNLTEYKAVEYGVIWPGSYSCSYTSCSYATMFTIVWPGDGVSHSWDGYCQPGPVAIPGWGWIYETVAGQICLVGMPATRSIAVCDCDEPCRIDYPDTTYCAGICGAEGEDPCGQVGCDPTTWGSIKAMFE
jgi:hypothetical protein